MLAIIKEILDLAIQLGPAIVQLGINMVPVEKAIAKILKGQTVTDTELTTLQSVSDKLHEAIQASPETE